MSDRETSPKLVVGDLTNPERIKISGGGQVTSMRTRFDSTKSPPVDSGFKFPDKTVNIAGRPLDNHLHVSGIQVSYPAGNRVLFSDLARRETKADPLNATGKSQFSSNCGHLQNQIGNKECCCEDRVIENAFIDATKARKKTGVSVKFDDGRLVIPNLFLGRKPNRVSNRQDENPTKKTPPHCEQYGGAGTEKRPKFMSRKRDKVAVVQTTLFLSTNHSKTGNHVHI